MHTAGSPRGAAVLAVALRVAPLEQHDGSGGGDQRVHDERRLSRPSWKFTVPDGTTSVQTTECLLRMTSVAVSKRVT
jgi:hypothetical protein